MAELNREQCVACREGAAVVTEAEIAELSPRVPEWKILSDGMMKLQRVFRFKNFAEAMQFSMKVGDLAEAQGHHPAILTEWGRVTVTWWTHAIRGLHRNDFIMAAKTDAVFNPGS
jgi:4a-hydroxytetrahydrobiopterin dehydratase